MLKKAFRAIFDIPFRSPVSLKNFLGYLYKFNSERMANTGVMLPVDESGNPDYAFMEQYIKERERQIVQNYIDYIGNNIQIGGV